MSRSLLLAEVLYPFRLNCHEQGLAKIVISVFCFTGNFRIRQEQEISVMFDIINRYKFYYVEYNYISYIYHQAFRENN